MERQGYEQSKEKTAGAILRSKGIVLGVEKRRQQCCFTGHRPEKLTLAVQKGLEEKIFSAMRDGYTTFLTGMARGVDLWAGAQVLALRRDFPFLKPYCVVPYEGFERRWPEKWRRMYWRMLEEADGGEVLFPAFTYASYQKRNRFMVDHSNRVIAVCNGNQGGTQNTIGYEKTRHPSTNSARISIYIPIVNHPARYTNCISCRMILFIAAYLLYDRRAAKRTRSAKVLCRTKPKGARRGASPSR